MPIRLLGEPAEGWREGSVSRAPSGPQWPGTGCTGGPIHLTQDSCAVVETRCRGSSFTVRKMPACLGGVIWAVFIKNKYINTLFDFPQ